MIIGHFRLLLGVGLIALPTLQEILSCPIISFIVHFELEFTKIAEAFQIEKRR
jgi:hypothetical protein